MFAETSIELLLPEVSYSVLFVTEYYLFIERSFLKSVQITKQFVIGNLVEYAIYTRTISMQNIQLLWQFLWISCWKFTYFLF